MKKLFIMVILICTAFITKAEEFKAFRVDLGFGYAVPNNGSGGVIASLEPKCAILPQINVGIRWEMAIMSHEIEIDGEKKKGKPDMTNSYFFTVDYHFSTKKFRPFAGIGTGTYTLAFSGNSEHISGNKTNFGFMGRVGFDVAHVRLAVEYNFAGKDRLGNSRNYLGLKYNFYIGGGVKNNN